MGDGVQITLIKNPFDVHGSREVLTTPTVSNLPANRYIDYLSVGLADCDFVISVNGKILEDDVVDLYPISDGDNIVFVPVPAGGDGGGKVLRSIAMIALVVVTAVAGGPLGAALGISHAGIATAVGSTIIMGAGGLLINAILPPTRQDLTALPYSPDFSESPTYSWQVVPNPTREGVHIPLTLGKAKITPPIISKHVTLEGDKQYLNLLFCLGYGVINYYDAITINDNPIANYESVVVHFRSGEVNQATIPYFDDTYIETPVWQKLSTQLTYTHPTTNVLFVNNANQIIKYSALYTTNISPQREATSIAFEVNFTNGLWGGLYWPPGTPSNPDESGYWTRTGVTANFRIVYHSGGVATVVNRSVSFNWQRPAFTYIFRIDNLPEDIYYAYLVFVSFEAYPYLPIGREDDVEFYPYKINEGAGDYSSNVGIYISKFWWADTAATYTTTSNAINRLGVAITCPNGLYGVNPETGALISETIQINIVIKETTGLHDAGEWIAITAATRNAVRRMIWFENLVYGYYEVFVSFVTDPGSGLNEVNDTYFDFLQEVINNDFSYPGLALLGMRILATDQLSGSMPRISLAVERRYEYINGVNRNCRNPAWACYVLLTNEKYGRGISTDKIIWADFSEWATYCSNNGLYVGVTFDVSMDLYSALAHISKVGRARVVQRGTMWGVVIDQPSIAVQVFNIANTSNFEEIYLERAERANVIEMTYYDENLDYEPQTMEVPFEEFTAEDDIIKASETLTACTSKKMAYDYARFLLNNNFYLRKVIKFDAALDAIATTVGDVFYFQNDVTQWGYGGRIEAGSTTRKLELDQYVTIEPATEYSILVRYAAEDRIDTRSILNLQGVTKTIHVSSSLSGTPYEDDIFVFGKTTESFKLFRCMSIKKNSDFDAKITALEYDSRVYDLATIPGEYEEGDDLPPVSNLTGQAVVDYMPWGAAGLYISLEWKGFAIAWDVYRMVNNGTWSKIAVVYEPIYKDYTVEYAATYNYSVYAAGSIEGGQGVSISTYTSALVPQDVENFVAAQYRDFIRFTWDKNPESFINSYVIRYGYNWPNGETIVITSGNDNSYLWPLPITGTYEFHIKALTFGGKKSATATTASITVYNTPESLHPVYEKDYLIEDYLNTINSPFPTIDPDDTYFVQNNFIYNRYDLAAYDAEQDFSGDYEEYDDNGKIYATSNTLTVIGINRDEVAYLIRDYGLDYFSADFKMRFKLNISDLASSTSVSNSSVSNSSSSSSSSSESAGSAYSLSSSSSSESSSESSSSNSSSESASSGSSSSSSSSEDSSFSSSSSSISFSSSSESTSSGSSSSSSSESTSSSSNSSESISRSSSSESSSSSSSSSSSNSNSSSSSSSSSLTYLASNDGPVVCGIVNTGSDFETATDDTGEYGVGLIIDDGQFKLIERSAGSSTLSTGYYFALNKDYYIEFRRIEPHTVGDPLGQYGYIYVDIYADSGYTSLAKALSLQLSEYPRMDMQYVLPVSSYNDGVPNSCNLTMTDFKVARPSFEYDYDNESDPYFNSNEIDLTYEGKYRARIFNNSRTAFNDPFDTTPGFTDRTDLTYPNDTDISITSEASFHFEYAYFIPVKTEPYYSRVGGAYSDWKKFSSTPIDLPKIKFFKWRCVSDFDNNDKIEFKFYQIKLFMERDEVVYRIDNQSISASGTTITFSDYDLFFHVEVDVGVIVVNASPVTATPVITAKSLGSVTIKVMDKADTAISATVNVTIQGY